MRYEKKGGRIVLAHGVWTRFRWTEVRGPFVMVLRASHWDCSPRFRHMKIWIPVHVVVEHITAVRGLPILRTIHC